MHVNDKYENRELKFQCKWMTKLKKLTCSELKNGALYIVVIVQQTI